VFDSIERFKLKVFDSIEHFINILHLLINMEKEEIRKIIFDQKENFEKTEDYFKRDIDLDKYINTEPIIIISGIRRAGKSTLLKIIKNKININNENNYLYLDFSDDRLNNFTIDDFQKTYEIYLENYNKGKKYFFFDEIQYIKGWEKFVNRLYEKEKIKIFITGSNSSLLSSEISSVLTGRNKVITLYPLSFKEYINNKIDLIKPSTKINLQINQLFEEYFKLGGFPYVLRTKDSDILKEYYTNIVYKDIIVRKKIRQIKEINVGQILSYNKILKHSKIKSTSTIKNFIEYLNEVFLIFTISKYGSSIRKQNQNPKKTYFIDTGILNKINTLSTENKGWLLENIIFLELLRNNHDIFYYKKESECDFLVKEGLKITKAIQVTYYLTNKNKEREINGLIDAMKNHNLKEGIIITREQQETINLNEYKIKVIPVWKWLLNID
jgi:uncharacterized protein